MLNCLCLFKNVMFIYKNTKSHSLLFLSVPVRIIPARTWRAVTPGRGAAVRVCVRARCHLFAPEEGTVTSRFDWRQRSLGNRPVVSQSVSQISQSERRAAAAESVMALSRIKCTFSRFTVNGMWTHLGVVLKNRTGTPRYQPNRTR